MRFFCINICVIGILFSNLLLAQIPQNPQERAFYFAEKAKRISELHAINLSSVTHFYDVPDSLLSQEIRLGIRIQKTENEILQIKSESDEKQKILKQLETLLSNQAALIQIFKDKYPSYYALKYATEIPSIKDVQATLTEEEAILDYFVGDSSIYLFLIRKEQLNVFEKKKPSHWDKLLDTYHTSLQANDYASYITSSTSLSRILLPQKEIKKLKTLYIIPDKELFYLSFDALLSQVPKKGSLPQNGSFTKTPLLIQKYTLGYFLSATHFTQNKSSQTSYQFAVTGLDTAKNLTIYEGLKAGNKKLFPSVSSSMKDSILANDSMLLEANTLSLRKNSYSTLFNVSLPSKVFISTLDVFSPNSKEEGEDIIAWIRALLYSNTCMQAYFLEGSSSIFIDILESEVAVSNEQSFLKLATQLKRSMILKSDTALPKHWAFIHVYGR